MDNLRKVSTAVLLAVTMAVAAACTATTGTTGKNSGDVDASRHHKDFHLFGDYTP